jgi:hypothetical protein
MFRLFVPGTKGTTLRVRRWQAFTGEKAILDGDGQPFAEVAAERPVSEGR